MCGSGIACIARGRVSSIIGGIGRPLYKGRASSGWPQGAVRWKVRRIPACCCPIVGACTAACSRRSPGSMRVLPTICTSGTCYWSPVPGR